MRFVGHISMLIGLGWTGWSALQAYGAWHGAAEGSEPTGQAAGIFFGWAMIGVPSLLLAVTLYAGSVAEHSAEMLSRKPS